MKNTSLWRRLLRLRTGPPPDRATREVIAKKHRREAFGEINERTRAEDRQRLADAAAGKADRLI